MAAKKRATKKRATKKAASKKRPVAKKAAAKKTAAKKAAGKKASGKKAASKKKGSAKKSPSPKSPSKSEILNHVAEQTNLSRKEVSAVFDAVADYASVCLKKRGMGAFRMPGLFKATLKHVPARKAGMYINHLAGGVEAWREAKPASKRVRVVALKGLKEAATK